MKWTQITISLHHRHGHGTIEVAWDDKAGTFRVDRKHSSDDVPDDFIHMEMGDMLEHLAALTLLSLGLPHRLLLDTVPPRSTSTSN